MINFEDDIILKPFKDIDVDNICENIQRDVFEKFKINLKCEKIIYTEEIILYFSYGTFYSFRLSIKKSKLLNYLVLITEHEESFEYILSINDLLIWFDIFIISKNDMFKKNDILYSFSMNDYNMTLFRKDYVVQYIDGNWAYIILNDEESFLHNDIKEINEKDVNNIFKMYEYPKSKIENIYSSLSAFKKCFYYFMLQEKLKLNKIELAYIGIENDKF